MSGTGACNAVTAWSQEQGNSHDNSWPMLVATRTDDPQRVAGPTSAKGRNPSEPESAPR